MKWLTTVALSLATLFAVNLASAEVARADNGQSQAPVTRHDARALTKKADRKQVVAEVMVLLASNDGKGIDPSIGNMPQLKRPPLSAYNSYKLLKRGRLTLTDAKAEQLALPNKGKLSLTYKKAASEKAENKSKSRVVVGARIDKPNGSKLVGTKVKARLNKIFFLSGGRHGKSGDALMVGIRISGK